MQPLTYPRPGLIVSVPVLVIYRHRGIVTDRYIEAKPCVLTTAPGRGVVEEQWDVFDPHGVAIREGYPGVLEYWQVLDRARRHLGRPYDLFGFNCDHLVADAHALPMYSPQLRATMTVGAVLGLALMAGR